MQSRLCDRKKRLWYTVGWRSIHKQEACSSEVYFWRLWPGTCYSTAMVFPDNAISQCILLSGHLFANLSHCSSTLYTSLPYVPSCLPDVPPSFFISPSPLSPPLSLFIYDQPLFSFQDNPIAIPKLRLTDHSKFGTFLTSKKVGGGSCMVANGQEIKFGQMQNIYRFWLWPLHWPMTLRTSGYLLTHCFSSLYAERLTGHWLWHHLRCLLVTRLGWRRLWSPWVATRYTSSVHSTRQFIYL